MLPTVGYKEALRRVLNEAVHNANYRKKLLSGSRTTAQNAINELVVDSESRVRILNVLYGTEGNSYKSKNVDSKSVIKLMAFICCSLKAREETPTDAEPRALYFPLSAQQDPPDYFETADDWESPPA
jgi:hypothetical protein